MSYIEKIFKQYPFLYCIKGELYAFGTGVCSKCDGSLALLEARYNNFVNNADEDLKQDDAWRIFHAVVAEADFVKHNQGTCLKPTEKIKEFEFDETALKELEEQVDRYMSFWEKYSLMEYARHI